MKFEVMGYKHGYACKDKICKKLNERTSVSLFTVKAICGESTDTKDLCIGWPNTIRYSNIRVRETKQGWFLYMPEPSINLEWKPNGTVKEDANEFMDILDDIVKEFGNWIALESEKLDLQIEMLEAFQSFSPMRRCIVKAKKSGPKEARSDRNAYFHKWITCTKGVTQELALVEFEDGHIEQVQPTSVIFMDHNLEGGESNDNDE